MRYQKENLDNLVVLKDSGTWGNEGSIDDGVPVLRSTNIQDNKLILEDIAWRKISKTHAEKKELNDGDIIVTTSSGSPQHIGKCCLFKKPKDNHKYYFSNFTIRLRPDINKVDPRWIYYWLSSPQGRAILDTMNNTTTGLRNLDKNLYLAQKIPLIPIAEQRRIAAILDKADGIRRKRQEAIRLTEELGRSLFLDMFGDPVTNPKGWEIRPLSKFGKILTGNTPPRADIENYGNDIEWIKSDNITTPYHFLTQASEYLSNKGKEKSRILPAGSILVCCIAGSRSSIGRAAIADREVAFNQQINAIIPNKDVDTYFLYAHFLTSQGLVQAQSTDSMKGLVNKSKFSSIQFLSPPLRKQLEFRQQFSKFIDIDKKFRIHLQESENLFNSLLQRAFRGEL